MGSYRLCFGLNLIVFPLISSKLEDSLTESVKYVVTNSDWSQDFEQVLT